MSDTTKLSGKDKARSKKSPQPKQVKPGGSAPAAAVKSASQENVMRKSAHASGKAASASRRSEEKPAKKEKQKKVKMVRDSFNMPEFDYAKIAELKKKCLAAGVHVKKSELLRLGLTHLSKLSNTALLRSVKQIERIKTGRPAKNR